jgi:signal transduction histidine kinase
MQQNYATAVGVVEVVPLESLLEDAIKINLAGFEREGVEIVRDFEGIPPITIDKHKIMQILINLVTNAKQAFREVDHSEKKLIVRAKIGDEGTLRVEIIDNGPGIDPDNVTKIFTHGFTTKKDGHGFGLHSSATAARSMKGSLEVQSEGVGRGAAFVLELPAVFPERAVGNTT